MSEHAHSTNETHAHNAHVHGDGKWELWLALLSGALLFAGWLVGRSLGEELFDVRGRYAARTIALWRWAETALLLFLFSLGHAIENYTVGRARRATTWRL